MSRTLLHAVLATVALSCLLMTQRAVAQPLPAQPVPAQSNDLGLDLGLPPADPPAPASKPAAPKPTPAPVAPSTPAPLPQAVQNPAAPVVPLPNVTPEPVSTPAPTGPQVPTLRIEKVGPPTLGVGKRLSYEIVVRNPSAVAVFNVRVEEELPAGAQFVSATPAPETTGKTLVWNLAGLDPGAERRFRIEVQPHGEGELASNTKATFSVSASLRTRITRPRLAVTAAAPSEAVVGQTVTFEIQVTNTGTGPAAHVVVHDHLPAALHYVQGDDIEADLGTIEPGQVKKLTLQATATKGGRVSNEVVVTGEDGLQARTQVSVNILEPALALHKSGPMRRYLNRDAEFDLEASNPGTAAAHHVCVMDVLPPGLEYVSASDNGTYDAPSRVVSWTLDELNPGEHRHLKVRAAARGVGDLVNRAVASAAGQLMAKSETVVHVQGIAALMLELVDLDDPVEVGTETSYEIRVRNQGTAPSTRLQILATAPDGMIVRGAEGPTPFRIQGQQVIFEPIPTLAPRADARFRVRVVGLKPGDMRFKVQMNADHLKQPVYEEESTQVYDDGK